MSIAIRNVNINMKIYMLLLHNWIGATIASDDFGLGSICLTKMSENN